MANRVFRFGFLVAPVAASIMALVSACSDDDAAPPGIDASTDAPRNDAGIADTFVPTPDSAVPDAGDADADAAPPPPLCATYPNNDVDGDAAAGEEGQYPRYELIAIRSMFTAPETATNSCEINAHFTDFESLPDSIHCLALQMASVAGCTVGGVPIDYSTVTERNGVRCVGDAGASVQLGFRNPDLSTYTVNDIDFMIEIVRKAAITTGMAPADAARLKTLLETQRAKAVVTDAGPGDAGFSQSTCP